MRVIYDHKRLPAAWTLPFEKNRLHIAVHYEPDVALWTCDFAVVEFHMWDESCSCESHRGK